MKWKERLVRGARNGAPAGSSFTIPETPRLRVGFRCFNIRHAANNSVQSMTSMVNKRKAVVELCLLLTAFFVLWTARVASYDAIDGTIGSPTLRAAYSNLLKLILWVLPASVFAYRVRGMPPAKYLGVSVLPSLRNWLLGF